jgi:peroxiredoxin
MVINKGDKAPDFTLRNTKKEEVSLSSYEGKKVVVLFFPLAFTGVCTDELCSVRDNMNVYSDLDAEVVAISVDSLFTLEKYKAEQAYNFPLLSDFNKDVSRSYGTLYENFVLDMKGVAKRSAFVIDGKGIVRYAEVLESAGDLPNFTAIQEVLKEI